MAGTDGDTGLATAALVAAARAWADASVSTRYVTAVRNAPAPTALDS